ncbi:NUDIX hydrolase [Lysinibacillus cavernae]|uniref:NUDIX hydrolase n=1 Tax=Lysinibacillus cavernae TaxID=2666135 RepID=UPI0012D8EA52|nr:NUDIX domain-containing protein [Lysinibacillus cavernae]
MVHYFVNWSGHHVKLTWRPQHTVQDLSNVTSVHGICFHQGRVLLVHVKNRGFNFPGGHVEHGETPEVTLHREVLEEGYVKGHSQYIGSIEVSHEENPLFIEGGKYPMIGYQLFYKMAVQECLPFLREHETIARIWVEPEEIPYVINDHELAQVILQEALTS